MANTAQHGLTVPTSSMPVTTETELSLPAIAQYALTLLLVTAATFLAFVASSVVPAPALTLIFVLPVVISGTVFGLGPAVAATVASVVAFDFFFTQPYLTLRMSDPSEIWAALLLLITAAIVCTVSWQSRQHALDARRAAAHAEELRRLAHAVIEGTPQSKIVDAATQSLGRIFMAPVAILSRDDGRLRVVATSGDAEVNQADIEAAEIALASGVHARGQTYPNDRSRFDMWPVATGSECQYVVAIDLAHAGHDRPADADRLVEIVAAYIISNHARAVDPERSPLL
ncbi:MAG: hypothetical protein JWO64_2392 [Hyphomicrobiales bacterium]|nr:hypothetical protein [Hyphomicrobiales bacterium]